MRPYQFLYIACLMGMLPGARSPIWVIDGDTIDIRGERVRIANLDAPELSGHSKCVLEQRRGENAKRLAIHIVRRAASIEIVDRQGKDRFGRTLARVLVGGKDFGATMIAAGVARPWRGRTSDWCRP